MHAAQERYEDILREDDRVQLIGCLKLKFP
jgi:hypothetical protein